MRRAPSTDHRTVPAASISIENLKFSIYDFQNYENLCGALILQGHYISRITPLLNRQVLCPMAGFSHADFAEVGKK
jgi:hypothetical protein